MSDGRTTFFKPGERSRCSFTPEQWCDVFRFGSPTSVPDFLCDVEPQTVGVILPPGDGERGELWDRVYQRIVEVLGGGRFGFRCFRSRPEEWVAPRPCEACAMARGAQVVIIELDGGDVRAESFRDMAAASQQLLAGFRENPVFQVPDKRVVLIHHIPVKMTPAVRESLHVIDYAGDHGPDLDRLEEGLRNLDWTALFHEGEPFKLPESEFELDVAIPKPGGDDGAPAAASPRPAPPDADEGSEREPTDGIEIRILPGDLGVESADAPGEIDSLVAAEARLEAGEPAAALRLLLGAGLRGNEGWHALIDRILGARDALPVLEGFLTAASADGTGPIRLSEWSDGAIPATTLELAEGLGGKLGRSLPLFVCRRLDAAAAAAVVEAITGRRGEPGEGAGGPTPVLVATVESEEPARRRLAELWHSEPAARCIEIRYHELTAAIRGGVAAPEFLRDQFQRRYSRSHDPYLAGIHRLARSPDFFGREDALERLCRLVAEGTAFAVCGLPRSGKTSLIHRLAETMEREGSLVVPVDLRRLSQRSAADVHHLLAISLEEALVRRYPESHFSRGRHRALDLGRRALLGKLLKQPEPVPSAALVNELSEVIGALAKDRALKVDRLVLIYDEVEALIPHSAESSPAADGPMPILEELDRLSRAEGLGIGLTGFGVRLHRELARPDCPLAGVVQVRIGGLDALAFEAHIRALGHRMQRYFADEGLAAISRASGRHPWLARYLCSTVLEARGVSEESERPIDRESVEGSQVESGLTVFLRSPNLCHKLAGIFREVERCDRDVAALLRVIAAEVTVDKSVDRSWLASKSRLQEPALGHLLDGLCEYGLLERVPGDEYRMQTGLLHQWLRGQVAE